jgi:hypothetical protein
MSSSAFENMPNNATDGLVNKKTKSKQLLPMNESAEKQNIPTEEECGNLLSSKCNKNETVENDLMFLQDMLNLTCDKSHGMSVFVFKNYASFMNLEVQSCRGQKRPFDHCIDLTEKENDLSLSNESSNDVINKLKKRCIDLENKTMKLEQTSMRMYKIDVEFYQALCKMFPYLYQLYLKNIFVDLLHFKVIIFEKFFYFKRFFN